jgi:hypothetical protein
VRRHLAFKPGGGTGTLKGLDAPMRLAVVALGDPSAPLPGTPYFMRKPRARNSPISSQCGRRGFRSFAVVDLVGSSEI